MVHRNNRRKFGAGPHLFRKAFIMRQVSKSLGNAQALERQHQGQTQAMAQRHTMEQKSLQETQEAKPAGKHEAPHG